MEEIKCYKSKDGTIFENKQDCLQHEIAIAGLRMYSSEGRTTDINNAAIIIIMGRASAKYLITLCEQTGRSDSVKGIALDSLGVFAWSYEEQRYFKIGSETQSALKHII